MTTKNDNVERIELGGGYILAQHNPTGDMRQWCIADAQGNIVMEQDKLTTFSEASAFAQAMRPQPTASAMECAHVATDIIKEGLLSDERIERVATLIQKLLDAETAKLRKLASKLSEDAQAALGWGLSEGSSSDFLSGRLRDSYVALEQYLSAKPEGR